METEWNNIKEYEGLYKISNSGQVKSIARTCGNNTGIRSVSEKILRPGITSNGYLFVVLCKNGVNKPFKIHILVAECFVQKYECYSEINHINGNKKDNNSINLEWTNRSKNILHAIKNGLIKTKISFLDAQNIRVKYSKNIFTQKEIGKIYGIDQSTVSDIINLKIWNNG